MKKTESNVKHPRRKGHLVQLIWCDWEHGPGTVVKMLGNGDVLVKWPRKDRNTIHNARYLKRIEEKKD